MAKMHQIRFRLGLRPIPRWGSLQLALPQNSFFVIRCNTLFFLIISGLAFVGRLCPLHNSRCPLKIGCLATRACQDFLVLEPPWSRRLHHWINDRLNEKVIKYFKTKGMFANC